MEHVADESHVVFVDAGVENLPLPLCGHMQHGPPRRRRGGLLRQQWHELTAPTAACPIAPRRNRDAAESWAPISDATIVASFFALLFSMAVAALSRN